MQHLVKKQSINLTLSKQSDAFRMQQQVSSHYWQDVLPLLATIFDELSSEEEVIQIERLEIDLGILSEKQINEGQWNNEILSRIKKQVYEKIYGKEKNTIVRHESATLSSCKQWLFYMQKGYLPWNVLYINEAFYNKVLETLAVDFTSVSELRRITRENPVAVKRIESQHDESFLVKLIEILTAGTQRELAEVIDKIADLKILYPDRRLSEAKGKREDLKREIWHQVIRLVASGWKPTAEQLIEQLLLQNTSHLVISTIIKSGAPSSFSILLPALKKLYNNPDLFSESKLAKGTDKLTEKESMDIKSDREIDEGGIFAECSGIVLVHPFLTSLFRHLQIVEEGKFVDELAQQKAIYLLHYVANGRATAQEYELVVAKILCEWPLQKPIEKDIEIMEDELNEADNMLLAVVEQWSVLKNTSVAGLREAFLHRMGKLYSKNDSPHLQVETNAIDVLLDQLPWNLSMIKLPWMKKILRVEWR